MKKQITLQNKRVDYTLRKSKRARRMRLAVYHDGSVVMTTPYYLRGPLTERFIRDKAGWLLSKLTYFKQFEGQPITRRNRRDYMEHKDKAAALIKEKVEYFARRCGYRYNKISIKNQKTCWGSCSKKKNLNFNYKLLFLPEKVQDYIVAHELCHLRELNHSKNFWTLLARLVPDYHQRKVELRLHALQLV